MIRTTLALSLLLALTNQALGQVVTSVKVTTQICSGRQCRIETGYGTAVPIGYIDNVSYWLTAAHNVERTNQICLLYKGKYYEARYIARYRRNSADIAILALNGVKVRGFCISATDAKVGDEVTVYSLRNGIATKRQTTVSVAAEPNRMGRSSKGHWFGVALTALQGESGGAILSKDNKLVGIISNTDNEEIGSTTSSITYSVTKHYLGSIPTCVGTEWTPIPKPDPKFQKPPASKPPAATVDLSPVLNRLDKISGHIVNISQKVHVHEIAIDKHGSELSELERRIGELERKLQAANTKIATLSSRERLVRIYTTDKKLVDSKTYGPDEPIDLYLVPKRKK